MSYILLVEDNPDNAKMMRRLLESEGWEVRHADHAMEGVRIAREERPRLILMDFNLPDIDGRSITLVIRRQLGGDQAPPVIAVTARTSEMDRQLAKRFGCSAFIAKPFEPSVFLETINQVLQKHEGGA